MKRDGDHPLHLSNTGSFGAAALGDDAPPPRSRSRRLARLARLWPLMAVALIGLGPIAAWGAYLSARDVHEQRVQLLFDEALAERGQHIEAQILSYGEVLHSLHGLYDSSREVEPGEFGIFTRQARGRHPCIDAVAWAAFDDRDDRDGHRLTYVEPKQRYAHLLRMDLKQGHLVRPALERSLRELEPVLTAPLVGDVAGPTTSSYGLLVLGVHDLLPDGSRGEALGAVLLAFRFNDLIGPPEGADGPPRMRLAVFDVTPGESAELAGIDGGPTEVVSSISSQRELELAGRRWRLSALPTRHFLASHESHQPLVIGGIVLLVWELLAGLLLALSHASRSNAVRRQGRNVARIMQSLGEGVIVAGGDGRVRLTNTAARLLIGSVLDDADAQVFERSVRFVHADSRAPYRPEASPLQRAMRGEVFDQQACFVYTPARPEGTYVSVSGSPLRDEWGKLLGGVLAIRDDTERRRAERELRAKDARLRERAVEMQLAAEVQKRLYPSKAPEMAGLDIVGAVRPADETCGDYYDFLELPDGSLLLAIGDVSGHGLGPALVMAETRAYVRSLARAGHSPHEILDGCNAQLATDLADDLFVTMLLMRVSADGRTLAFASAGHTPALLFSRDGALKREMIRSGPPLGILEDHRYRMEQGIPFEDDDVLVLMTDGVTEASAEDDRTFEEQGVADVVASARGMDAAGILGSIEDALVGFAGERMRRDDVTLVVCKRTGAPRPRRRERRLSTTWSD